ncbi:MAG: ANTAR domain-containing response regulator, partial [Betaproteobacteria bacterium]
MTDWAGRVQRLEAEVSGLRRAMQSRGLIEQAKGRLAERWGVDAEQAFQLLSQQSQATNVRVVDVAAQVMGSRAPAGPEAVGAVTARADGRVDGWVDSVVDVLDEPALVLSPLWTSTGARIDDFLIEHANPASVRLWGLSGGSPVGRRLVDTAPEAALDGTLELLAQAYDGRPVGAADTVRAARVGDRLLASWPATGRADLGWIEEMGGLGWGFWSRTSARREFSAGLYRLLDRDPADGPLSLDQVIAMFAPGDRSRAHDLVGSRARTSPPATDPVYSVVPEVTSAVDVSLARTGRRLRMFVLPQLDPGGRAVAVLVLFQDVTENRRMSAMVDRLTARELHAAVERAQNEHLRAALLPAPLTRARLGPVTVLARHAAPAEMGRFRGDFYEIRRVGPGLT